MNTENSSAYTVQSVTKAFELLMILSDQKVLADLPHLSAKVAMTRNKTFRTLTTLVEMGLVERDPQTGFYQLGTSAILLAQKMLKHSSVINLAHPIMEKLAKRHGEAVYMTVIRGDEVVFLDMVDCEQQIKAMPLVGEKFPFFTNAAGKVIKALETRDLPDWLSQKRRGRAKLVPNPENLHRNCLRSARMAAWQSTMAALGKGSAVSPLR